MRPTKRARVYLQDEIPAFGSGWRILVAQEGRKWVHLTDPQGRQRKILLALWRQIQEAP